jgi:hypothetical protein
MAFRKGFILYSGSLAQPAGNGGLTWFHLQFILGFRRLGYDVLFVDRLAPAMCRDRTGRSPCAVRDSVNLRYFLEVMSRFGVTEREYSLSLEDDYGRETERLGLTRAAVRVRARKADFLLNAMGFHVDAEINASVGRRVFLDMDPGFGQMWRELRLHDPFDGHNRFVTLGRNIGRPNCTIPTCGLHWLTIAQPVVLEHWPRVPPAAADNAFTGIGAWRGPTGPVTFGGTTYGLRCHEFRQFFDLPGRCPETRFEIALSIDQADHRDLVALSERGWTLADPAVVAGDPWRYRDFIASSRAEFMVPKQMYVATRSGLLSDRSVYYLASGRPVLARDTHLGAFYPIGHGLLTFATLDEAASGVEEIHRHYKQHCQAARDLAEEYFDSDRVLPRLIDQVMD